MCRELQASAGRQTNPRWRPRISRKSVMKGANVLTKEASGRYDATECPGQPFLWLSARESARTRALSGGSPLGRVVLGALDFLGQALGWGATADAAFSIVLPKKCLSASSVG